MCKYIKLANSTKSRKMDSRQHQKGKILASQRKHMEGNQNICWASQSIIYHNKIFFGISVWLLKSDDEYCVLGPLSIFTKSQSWGPMKKNFPLTTPRLRRVAEGGCFCPLLGDLSLYRKYEAEPNVPCITERRLVFLTNFLKQQAFFWSLFPR